MVTVILRMFNFLILAAYFVAQGSFAQAELISGSNISFGNWSGGAYTNDASGSFSHCAVSASYTTGDFLYFSLTRSGTVVVGVESSRLNLNPGSEFPVALYVDRRAPIYGTANANNTNFATLSIPNLELALDAFKRGRGLVIEGQGLRGSYDLTGTFRALDQLRQCAFNYYNFAQSPKNTQNLSADVDASFLYQIATRTITSFGITDFQFDNAETIAALGLGEQTVRWIAPNLGVSGTIIAVKHEAGSDIRSSDAADIKYVASFCDDEFASSTRNLSEDGQQIREIRLLCISPEQQTEHYISKFLVDDLVVYTWFQFEGTVTMPSGGSNQSEASNAAITAARFALE